MHMTQKECMDIVYTKNKSMEYFEKTDESENGYINLNGFVHLIKTREEKTDIIISDNSKIAVQTESYQKGDMLSRIHVIIASDPTIVYGARQENVIKTKKEGAAIKLNKIHNEDKPFFTLERINKNQKIICTIDVDQIEIQKFENNLPQNIETNNRTIIIPIKDIENVLLHEHRQFAKSEPRLQQTLINISRVIKRETRLIEKIKNRLTKII